MRGNNVGAKIQSTMDQPEFNSALNDLFLHALFARLAFKNNDTYEFKTKYNKSTNSIELDIPDRYLEVLDQITGIQRGPNFKKFVNWLIGSRQFIEQDGTVSSRFLSISDINIWFGATFVDINQGNLSILLPTKTPSAINANFKTAPGFSGPLSLDLEWVYLDGQNTSWFIKCNITIIDASGNPSIFTEELEISTFNLISKDIRSTTFINIPSVGPDSLIDITIYRNYSGSIDAKQETIGILGIGIT